ncbi:MAG: creatininase family protein [Ruminococcaceae bacterium]|nr:creatininase family protein [Oscillospiraceae bacterium]
MVWEYLRSEEFKAAVDRAQGVCAVPIGCLEKHGPHAPLGTDTIQAERITRLAAEKEPVVVFPTMYFGEKCGAGEFPGTVIFSLETRWHIFRETCAEIFRNGFRKILFVNGHGGNLSMLDFFIRGMLKELPEVLVFSCDAFGGGGTRARLEELIGNRERYGYLTDGDRAILQDFIRQEKRDGHAGFGETAHILHLMPETLRLDGLRDESGDSTHRFDDFARQGIQSSLAWMANYPNSYQGSNDYVLNERIARAVTEHAVYAVAERFRFLKEERISDTYHAEWLKKQ